MTFATAASLVQRIYTHIGEAAEPPPIALTRRPMEPDSLADAVYCLYVLWDSPSPSISKSSDRQL